MYRKAVSVDEIEAIKRRLKKVEEVLELTPIIKDFEWKQRDKDGKEVDVFTERQRAILNALYKYKEGLTTTEIAKEIGLHDPETTGRVLILRAIKKIKLQSKRIKGSPIITKIGRKWLLNYDEFSFFNEKPSKGEL
jgi:DNA-binding NarL/FixJ family response regulator